MLGGGIVGITAAYLLKRASMKVTVLEARKILKGVTGHTTGKLTSQHGLKHDHLISTRRVASGGADVRLRRAGGAARRLRRLFAPELRRRLE